MNKTLSAIREARKASKRAWAPYSKSHVGCAIITASGDIFVGANVENNSYGATICAERVAACQYAMKTCRVIDDIKLVVVTNEEEVFNPCGICLQFLRPFCVADTEFIVYCPKLKHLKRYRFKELLPNPF